MHADSNYNHKVIEGFPEHMSYQISARILPICQFLAVQANIFRNTHQEVQPLANKMLKSKQHSFF